MMNGRYLIPANSKKSEMILSMFTPVDLILFSAGVGLTIILIMAIHTESIVGVFLLLLPALIASFLVFPIPNYHNVLQLIINIYTYFFVRQRTYKWRGWCYKNGNSKQK